MANATLTKITERTWRGELDGWQVTISSAGGWHCHLCPVGEMWPAYSLSASSQREAIEKGRARIEQMARDSERSLLPPLYNNGV